MNLVHIFDNQVQLSPENEAIFAARFVGKFNNRRNFLGLSPKRHPVKADSHFYYESFTYKELYKLSFAYAALFKNLGIGPRKKVLLFIRPDLSFTAITFALFRIGAIPVFIDPGMGLKGLLACIKKVKAEVIIAEEIFHFFSYFFPRNFKEIKHFLKLSGKKFLRVKSLEQLFSESLQKEEKGPSASTCSSQETIEMDPDDLCAILFTSGATGTPKGVEYTHRVFIKQIEVIKGMISPNSSERDLAGFPLFSLFSVAMGMTSFIPKMNFAKPAQVNPKYLVEHIRDLEITFAAGSPAIWSRVAKYCLQKKISLPSIRYLTLFGAPVSPLIHENFSKVLPNGDTLTPYGATEALPVSYISGRELNKLGFFEKMKNGHGICVGKPFPHLDISLIPVTHKKFNYDDIPKALPLNEVGEIIVSGDNVTGGYFNEPHANENSKIRNLKKEHYYHRMGDLGFFDENGYLWFLGRKAHRVESADQKIYYPSKCEAIANEYFGERTALIGIGHRGDEIPAIVVEGKSKGRNFCKNALKDFSSINGLKGIKKIFSISKFPVDRRHNIKIDRPKLKKKMERKYFSFFRKVLLMIEKLSFFSRSQKGQSSLKTPDDF